MENQCPACHSTVLYRYGKTASGKRRYLCVMCNRQFVRNPSRQGVHRRPCCPNCGVAMHVYMREPDVIRFRCARYPACKTFVKMSKEGEGELFIS